MTQDERKARNDARYRRLRELRPDLWRRAVEFGSIVTCAPIDEDRLKIAARVEGAVVALMLEFVDE